MYTKFGARGEPCPFCSKDLLVDDWLLDSCPHCDRPGLHEERWRKVLQKATDTMKKAGVNLRYRKRRTAKMSDKSLT